MPRARRIDLLTIDEVAELLRITPGSVRGLLASGRLAGIRISKSATRVERSELFRFLASCPTTSR